MVNLNVKYARGNYALQTLIKELVTRWGKPARAPEFVAGSGATNWNYTGHNADANGVVHGVDLFFAAGSNWNEARGRELAELLRKEGLKGVIPGHPDRMYYIIYRDRIAGDFSGWEWVGAGYAHWDHIHISTCDLFWGDRAPIPAGDYDSKAPWNLFPAVKPTGGTKPPAKPAPAKPKFDPARDIHWVVSAGDTMTKIQRHYNGPTIAQIAAYNGIKDPNKLTVGQRVYIPGPLVWIIEVPDTIRSIAKYYGLDPAYLAKLNGLPGPDSTIYIGNRLTIKK